jgi:hypothetical protein
MAMQFIFCYCINGKDQSVANLIEKTFEDRLNNLNFDIHAVFHRSMRDVAAKGVAHKFESDFEEESCLMHQSGKVFLSACGALVKPKNKKAVNPFNAGVAVMTDVHNAAVYFSYGEIRSDLFQHMKIAACPDLVSKVDLNGT